MARLIREERSATALRIRKACRNIPPVMKDAPDVDMIDSLDVEDQIGKSRDPAGAQARQFQLMRKSRRSRTGVRT